MDEEVWNEYIRLDNSVGISEENSVRNYLGYQWTASRDEGTVKDLIVLGRFSKVRSDYLSIARFIAMVLIFGIAGGAVWDINTNCVFQDFPKGCGAKVGWLSMYLFFGFLLIGAKPLYEHYKQKVVSRLRAKN